MDGKSDKKNYGKDKQMAKMKLPSSSAHLLCHLLHPFSPLVDEMPKQESRCLWKK